MVFMLHRNWQIGYSDSLMAPFISASQYIQKYLLVNCCCRLIQVPTIDQDNGISGTEPTETLQTFRSDKVLRPSHKNKRQVVISCSSFYMFGPLRSLLPTSAGPLRTEHCNISLGVLWSEFSLQGISIRKQQRKDNQGWQSSLCFADIHFF